MKKLLMCLCFLFLSSGVIFSQKSIHTKSHYAIKKYKRALSMYKKDRYDAAYRLLNIAIDKDSDFLEAYILSYRIAKVKKDTLKQIANLSAVLSRSKTFAPNAFFILGDLYFSKYEYARAQKCYENFLSNTKFTNVKRDDAVSLINDCSFAKEALLHSYDVEIKYFKAINSKYKDYWPFINVYSNEILFTRLSDDDARSDENLMIYNVRDSLFVDLPFNSCFNEGSSSITADGKCLFFSSDFNGGYGSQDIYVSIRDNMGWHNPKNLGNIINTEAWESQVSVSADGKYLYFASNRKGGRGGSDIYRSKILRWSNDGIPEFSKPENLSINTKKDEMSPCIYPNNKILFFSSKGFPGMGGFDVYKSILNEGVFSEPKNMGFPINSNVDELGFSFSQNGDVILFSSERNGGMDLYTCELPKKLKENAIINRVGYVVDENGDILNSRICVDGKFISNCKDELMSIFLSCKQNHSLNVISEGYNVYSEELNLKDSTRACSIYGDVILSKIKIGEKTVLKNVEYDFDSYSLKKSSYLQLSLLYDFLNLNKLVKIEIAGHTDNIGSDKYNLLLSINRAKSIYNYLVEKGISKDRLIFKGYGNSFPIVSNAPKKAQCINRRTEIKIISK